jgi:hypothetical protein
MTSKIVKSTTIDEPSSGRVSRTRQACLSCPSHHKVCHLACEESSFFPDAFLSVTWSASLHPPAAEPAPHRLLTFSPAVPRCPDKTPLSVLCSLYSIPRTTSLVSSRAAGPDSRHSGSKESKSVPCQTANVICRQWLLRSYLREETRSQTEPTGTGAKSLLRQVCAWRFKLPKCSPSRIPARALTHGKAACQFISRAPSAEPLDRSICFNRCPLCKSLL